VFEFGSGGSTFFFARRAACVTSIESDPVWYAHITTLAQNRGLDNVDYRLEAMNDDSLDGYQQHPFFRAVQKATWDLILIDSFCGYRTGGSGGQLRPYAFSLSLAQLNPGGMIVVDDSWLYPELLRPLRGWSIEDYVGVGPCRYGVSSTAIFCRHSNWSP
jgi:predicted O-methyltransferase YrrM